MKTMVRLLLILSLTLGAFFFISCNANRGMPYVPQTEGHDAGMGGGTGTGTIGDDPTKPSIENP